MQICGGNERNADPFEFEPDDRVGKDVNPLEKDVADVYDGEAEQERGKRARDRVAQIVREEIEEERERDDDDRGREDDIAERERGEKKAVNRIEGHDGMTIL